MKALLEPITDALSSLNKQQFKLALYAAIAFFIVICGGLVFWHISAMKQIQQQYSKINEQRKAARILLGKQQLVNEQKYTAEENLSKDKNYKLIEGIGSLVQQLGLQQKVKSRNIVATEDSFRGSGYAEVQAELVLTGLNTFQLVKLLQAIEENQRLFLKKVTIEQPVADGPLNVTLSISTLQQRTEGASA